jgi:hypothetical protein
MRRRLLLALPLVASLAFAGGARAVVVDMNAVGQTTVAYDQADQSGYFGVALVPGSCGGLSGTTPCGALAARKVPTVSSSAPCLDPALSSDLWLFGQTDRLPDGALCYHGGAVMHRDETFALTWDAPLPNGAVHNYWSGTRGYLEQFLKDVASASGTLGSPYAITTQYTDGGGRAENSSLYGGGCIDYGAGGGSTCEFPTSASAGHNLPAGGCTPTGDSFTYIHTVTPNSVCLTDAQLRAEVATMASQTGMVGRTQPGYSPEVVLLTPPGVEVCLDQAGRMCSVNGNVTPPAPAVTTSATGGKLAAGTYTIEVTYVLGGGESLASAPTTVTTTSATSTITITSPPPASGVTGWYAYVTQPNSTTLARQQAAGSPTPIGSSFTLSTPPVSGSAPPLAPLFCSYHSQLEVGGTEVAYVVQPWTAMTACDEPDAPVPGQSVTPQQLATDVGAQLVSPLSQSQIASIVDPGLNGWFALDGAEINDNGGCVPVTGADSVTIGAGSYLLQREFNNGGAIVSDPSTYFGCAPGVILDPAFVVPSSVAQGDIVQFDGSATASTLLVPSGDYRWSFGDGATATGPSVEHAYAQGGSYTVTLTVTDRGGNTAVLRQVIQVLGPNGLPVPPSSSSGSPAGLAVRVQLLPQGLGAVLRHGVALRVTSNEAANGFVTISISRRAARRAGFRTGRLPFVVIARGTVSGIRDGRMMMRLRMSGAAVQKLHRLRHVTLTIRLALRDAAGRRVAVDVAGNY